MTCACLRRHPLRKGIATLLLTFAAGQAASQAPVAVSPELQKLLDTEAWQLDYQVSFKASAAGNWDTPQGMVNYQKTLSLEASETVPLTVRSQGATIAMMKVTANLSNPAVAANMQKTMLDIAMQSDSIASWILSDDGGLGELGDDASAEQLQAAILATARKSVGTITLDYSEQTRGERLHNELGSLFNQTVRTTRRGTGGVTVSGQQITLEINAATKRVALLLPVKLPAVFESTYQEQVVTTTEFPPGAAPSNEEKASTGNLDDFPSSIAVTDTALGFGQNAAGVLIDDPLALQGGKLSGQHSTTASYDDFGTPVNGTLAVKYTLTPR